MKILAIAGKNLASLSHFELRLDTAPLDQEGLFAITGPTGAGKSTILDAMCVSLYDRMPRLPRSKTKLSEEEGNPFTNLTLSDPRHIMRRGAKSCYAETTFLGVDGDRYKARWEVPATQRKNAKSLKKPVISLENLDQDTLFVDKKRQVQERILEKVGLTFEQFCRSVFLAQGDFAAFLKADGDARAELLERMTGTEIYRELSSAAFERAKLEREALEKLQTQMDARDILTPEARDELDEITAAVEEKRTTTQQAWQEHNRIVIGHEKTKQLEQALAEAKTVLAAASQAKDAQEDARQALDTWEKLGDGREAWVTKKRLDEQLTQLEEQKAAWVLLLPQKAAMVADLETALAATKKARVTCEQQIAAEKPALDAARKCDHQLETAAATKHQLIKQREAQQEHLTAQQQAVKTHENALNHWQNQFQIASQALNELAPFEPLRQSGSSWKQDLAQFLDLASDIRAAALAQGKRLWQLLELENHSLETQKALERGQVGLQALANAVEGLEREDPHLNQSRWAEKFHALQSRGHTLEKLTETHEKIQELRENGNAAKAQHRELLESLANHEKELAQLQQELPQIAGQQQEAKANLERVLLASSESAQAMRNHLVAGKPCPVCGSTNHPHHEDTPFDPLISQTRERVEALEAQLAKIRARMAQLERDHAHDQSRLATLDQEAQSRQALEAELLQQATTAAKQHPQTANLSVGTEELTQRLPTLFHTWQLEKTELEVEKEELQQQDQQRLVFRQALGFVRRRLNAQKEASQELEQRRTDTQHQLELARTRCEDRSKTLTHLTQRLHQMMAQVPHWQHSLARQRHAFIEELAIPVSRLEKATHQFTQAEQEKQRVAPLLAASKEAANQGVAQLESLVNQVTSAERSWQELQQQRLQLFEGRTVQEVEAAYQSRLSALDETQNQQTEARELEQVKLQDTRTALGQVETSIAHIKEDLSRCATTLKQVLEKNNFALDQVQSLLEKDAHWAAQQRQALQELLATWNRAQGSQKSAEEQLKAHQEVFTETGSLEEALAARETAQSEKELLDTESARLQMLRETDEKARADLGKLQTAFETQARQWELWDSMRDLIGSHDGKKFRIYAQSLTLDMLLHHANHHLKDLARRYRLERLPGADLALRIVDRDMGDEIRSVNSLSGGETFLVSLALALGLATFTTSQTPIESLFIDEGFGSLDAESLEIALDTLEALQAMGRQVGVISHVQTLVERIAAQVQVRKVGGGHSEVRIRYRH